MNGFLRVMRFSAWTLLAMLLASLVIAGVLSGLAHEGVLPLGDAGSWRVVVDGEEFSELAELGELSLGHDEHGVWGWAGVFLAIAVTVFSLLVVLPLCLLLGVGVPMLGVLLALGAVAVSLAGVAALLSAPLLLPVLLVVWVLRRDRRRVHQGAAVS